MQITSDHQLAAKVARELSSPEPAVHFGASLVVATLIASPVLVAALVGRQAVSDALALYLLTLVVVWVVAGLVGGALVLAGPNRFPARAESEQSEVPEAGPRPASPPAAADSVGSNGAH